MQQMANEKNALKTAFGNPKKPLGFHVINSTRETAKPKCKKFGKFSKKSWIEPLILQMIARCLGQQKVPN